MDRLYTYFPKWTDDEYIWCLHETLSDQIVYESFFVDDVTNYMEFLENGGGFAGFTPSFVLNQIAPPAKDLNEAFEMEFT